MANIEFYINIDEDGTRLDKFIAKNACGFALSQKLIRQKQVLVNYDSKPISYKLQKDDKVEIIGGFLQKSSKNIVKKPIIDTRLLKVIKKSIIFKDSNLIAINKPSGVAVQGGSGINFSIDAILSELKFEKEETPRLVHRLDKDTSGVLLIARNRKTADSLTEAFREKTIKKTYLATVRGVPKKKSGIINIPLLKKFLGKNEKVYKDLECGKEAITHYRVLQNYGDYSILELKPITGRTHQIRVHCKEIGHAIIGDSKYGGKNAFIKELPKRLHLHSQKVVIEDFFGEKLEIEAKADVFKLN